MKIHALVSCVGLPAFAMMALPTLANSKDTTLFRSENAPIYESTVAATIETVNGVNIIRARPARRNITIDTDIATPLNVEINSNPQSVLPPTDAE